jgi:hypothetical protein
MKSVSTIAVVLVLGASLLLVGCQRAPESEASPTLAQAAPLSPPPPPPPPPEGEEDEVDSGGDKVTPAAGREAGDEADSGGDKVTPADAREAEDEDESDSGGNKV